MLIGGTEFKIGGIIVLSFHYGGNSLQIIGGKIDHFDVEPQNYQI